MCKRSAKRGLNIIRNIIIIRSGILLLNHDFEKGESTYTGEMNLMTGFISAIQSFSREITGSNVKTINFDNFIFHFYKDPRYNDLIFLFITDNDFKKKYKSIIIKNK